MTDRQQLQHLFNFDFWCTRKLSRLYFKEEPFSEQKSVLSFLSHIINAQKVWFGRVVPHPAFNDVKIWEAYQPDELIPKAEEGSQLWIDLIGDHEVDLDTQITYQNSKNITFRNSIRQICHHLIIHGQHHRAQILIFLRNCDITPPQIDYIHFARKNNQNKFTSLT